MQKSDIEQGKAESNISFVIQMNIIFDMLPLLPLFYTFIKDCHNFIIANNIFNIS